MPRKEFPESVVQSILIKSRRHCCICDKFCGQKIAIHHIDKVSDASEQNAIPLCLECHAEVRAYDPKHPIGKKYTKTELYELKKRTFEKHAAGNSAVPVVATEYGRGFHDGSDWAKLQTAIVEIWRLISTNGDFALEILFFFRNADTHTMMDELLFSKSADSGRSDSQYEGHMRAWFAGEVLGLWGTDGDTEELFLTEKGKVFKNMVNSSPDLSQRYRQLDKYWRSHKFGKSSEKPKTLPVDMEMYNQPGPINYLTSLVNCLASLSMDPSRLYVIRQVHKNSVRLSNIEDGTVVTYLGTEIQNVRLNQKTGNFVIKIKPPIAISKKGSVRVVDIGNKKV